MGIFTKEDKQMLVSQGIEQGLKFFNDYREVSRKKREKDLEDNKIDKSEYQRVCNELDEYQTYYINLISDTELGSKFKQTEEIFVLIIKIIMFDLEFDYKEVLDNLCNFIDNEDFINNHGKALSMREERLDEEYKEAMKKYKEELAQYEMKIKAHNSKGFFKKIISSGIKDPMPVKPKRRE
ncbi:hypothetical protein [Tenacibaculum maritimum]|uniref:hypothetical protein n=1 Tax=Tenacibaculum maritimum TaxID=107401 RepID=UPI0038770836